jgi:DNA-binding NarL/FixJ family response regulator
MSKKIVTRESVQTAIIQLLGAGKSLSLVNIKQITGGGFPLIREYRRELLAGADTDDNETTVDSESKTITDLVDLNQSIERLESAISRLSEVILQFENSVITMTEQLRNREVTVEKPSDDRKITVNQPSKDAAIKAVKRIDDAKAVMRLLSEGITVAEIARRTGLSESTVRRIRDKQKND